MFKFKERSGLLRCKKRYEKPLRLIELMFTGAVQEAFELLALTRGGRDQSSIYKVYVRY